jgi:hypothetical protein
MLLGNQDITLERLGIEQSATGTSGFRPAYRS